MPNLTEIQLRDAQLTMTAEIFNVPKKMLSVDPVLVAKLQDGTLPLPYPPPTIWLRHSLSWVSALGWSWLIGSTPTIKQRLRLVFRSRTIWFGIDHAEGHDKMVVQCSQW